MGFEELNTFLEVIKTQSLVRIKQPAYVRMSCRRGLAFGHLRYSVEHGILTAARPAVFEKQFTARHERLLPQAPDLS
jgi:hypothetical protein